MMRQIEALGASISWAHHYLYVADLNVFDDILLAVVFDGLAILTLLDLLAVFDTVDQATLLRRLNESNGYSGVIMN